MYGTGTVGKRRERPYFRRRTRRAAGAAMNFYEIAEKSKKLLDFSKNLHIINYALRHKTV